MEHAPLRVASYNIRKARGLDLRRDPKRILDVLNTLDADVVVLQEADHRLGARKTAIPVDVLAQHSDFVPVAVAENDVSLGWHGNAVLVKPALKATDVSRIALPGFEPRGAVAMTIQGVFEFRLVATHLGLRRKDRRAQQQHILSSLMSSGPTVIAGDFNEWSKDRGLEAFASRYTIHAPGHSFHARRPISALDRIALSDHLALSNAGVEEGDMARRASDHLPIWGDVVPQPSGSCSNSVSAHSNTHNPRAQTNGSSTWTTSGSRASM